MEFDIASGGIAGALVYLVRVLAGALDVWKKVSTGIIALQQKQIQALEAEESHRALEREHWAAELALLQKL